jgi:hypothetical protein
MARVFAQFDPRGKEVMGVFSFSWLSLSILKWVPLFTEKSQLADRLLELERGEMYRMPRGGTIIRRVR